MVGVLDIPNPHHKLSFTSLLICLLLHPVLGYLKVSLIICKVSLVFPIYESTTCTLEWSCKKDAVLGVGCP
jgi:hypothetical protein